MPKLTPQQEKILRAAEAHVRKQLEGEASGHDWYHIDRVRRMALRIGKQEKVDLFLVELMALLHDLHDRKVTGNKNEHAGLQATQRWLRTNRVPQRQIEEIMYVIENQSFSQSGLRDQKLASKAGQVMQDADRLDAIGAIGIGRTFAFNGKTGNAMHNPSISPRTALSTKQYQKDNATTINHFYEKLLKLKDLMNTKTGKRIAAQRHTYMKAFLKEFLAEWDGKK